jgi:(5-formylfuran-3-yl)methyl phosphate synthase
MTRLLVSVRSAAEAEVALAGGADIIDVKEPRQGALGPADPQVWQEIQQAVGGRVVTSVALGELLIDPVGRLAPQTLGYSFAKIGLAGCGRGQLWFPAWNKAIRLLPSKVAAVPVAYADWRRADAPEPAVVVELAARLPARLVLIDTHDKTAGGLLDHQSFPSLEAIAHRAARANVGLALAGSLDAAAIELLLALRPAYVGVRGAACEGGRDGTIELARVKSLVKLVHGTRKKLAS